MCASNTKMVILTRIGGFGYREPQHTLCEKVSPSLPYSDQTSARLFVKLNQVARYKYTVIFQVGIWDPVINGVRISDDRGGTHIPVHIKGKVTVI